MSDPIRALIPIADGSEDLESVTLIDVFRRADWDVTVASIHEQNAITAARGTQIVADQLLADCQNEAFDLIALPGGLPGAQHFADSRQLSECLLRQREQGRWIAAICAAPALVLAPLGLLDNQAATCYPSFSEHLPDWQNQAVIVGDRMLTSQGPGTALAFALRLIEALDSAEKAVEIAQQMLVKSKN